jgi:hypothetical protein
MLSTSRKYLPRLLACDTRDISLQGKEEGEHANILRCRQAFSHPASNNIFLSKGCFDRDFSSKNVKRGQNGMSLFSQTAKAQV